MISRKCETFDYFQFLLPSVLKDVDCDSHNRDLDAGIFSRVSITVAVRLYACANIHLFDRMKIYVVNSPHLGAGGMCLGNLHVHSPLTNCRKHIWH